MFPMFRTNMANLPGRAYTNLTGLLSRVYNFFTGLWPFTSLAPASKVPSSSIVDGQLHTDESTGEVIKLKVADPLLHRFNETQLGAASRTGLRLGPDASLICLKLGSLGLNEYYYTGSTTEHLGQAFKLLIQNNLNQTSVRHKAKETYMLSAGLENAAFAGLPGKLEEALTAVTFKHKSDWVGDSSDNLQATITIDRSGEKPQISVTVKYACDASELKVRASPASKPTLH